MISQERLEGNWNSILGAVKEKFGQVTGDELTRVRGSVDKLIGLIERKTGRSREQIEAFLDECCQGAESTVNRVASKASEYADMAGEAVRENYDRLATEAQRGYDYTVTSMKRRPLESVAIALGAGMVAGLLVGLSLAGRRQH